MKILLDQVMTGIDGNPDLSTGKSNTLGETLGRNILMASSADPVTRLEWGLTLCSNKELQVTPKQFEEIQKFATEMGISDLYKGQIVIELNKQYEEQNKK